MKVTGTISQKGVTGAITQKGVTGTITQKGVIGSVAESGYTYDETGRTILTINPGNPGVDFTTLEEAFAYVNGTGNDLGDVVIKIAGITTETTTAILYESSYGGSYYSSVTIYPTVAGLSITGNLAGDLITFNGCSNVIIDGRVNRLGADSLSIENTNGTTIHYIGVTNTQVLHCNVTGDIIIE